MPSSNKHFYLVTNFSDESLALIQWCIEEALLGVTVLSVNTGLMSEAFYARVESISHYIENKGLLLKRLTPKKTFIDCVRDRGSFPSKKFQWCASFLKGLTLNQYLDDVDESCEGIVLLAKRREVSRSNQRLQANSEESEYYNDRQVFYPLLNYTRKQRDELIKRAGFTPLFPISLECAPCIHATEASLALLTKNDIARITLLEQEIGQTMFDRPIRAVAASIKEKKITKEPSLTMYEKSCGSPWGCGE